MRSGYENWFKFYFIFKLFLRIEHVLSSNSDSVLRVFVSFIGSSCSSSHVELLLLAPLDLLLTWGCYFFHVVITFFLLLLFTLLFTVITHLFLLLLLFSHCSSSFPVAITLLTWCLLFSCGEVTKLFNY